MLEISENILDSADRKQIACVMTIDESSAFDCVRHSTLEDKLKMYNFSEEALMWFRCYLSYRSEYVSIGAKNSHMEHVTQGVPQGSVLGPVIYSIYTNEITEITKNEEDCHEWSHQDNEDLFGQNCLNCGATTTYADDATVVVAKRTRDEIQTKLEDNLNRMTDFLESNQLVINQSKTTITETMVKQKRVRMTQEQPTLTVINEEGELEIVTQTKENRILGGNLKENLSWSAQLVTGKKATIPTVRKMLGALKLQSQVSTTERKTSTSQWTTTK